TSGELFFRKSRNKQLESTGGGFNTNVNQNNEFSPSFGNIGNLGAMGRALGGETQNKGSNDETKSDERERKPKKKSRSKKRKNAQLQSSGGGYNANVNQNNEFSPSFGNIGDLGSMGRALKTRGNNDVADSSEEQPKGGKKSSQKRRHDSQEKQPKRGKKRSNKRRHDSEESDAQLHSTAGGFNANVNQNNEFSPSFGNIGNLGAQGRSIDGRGRRREENQLHSTGGGFNANVNQNNEFSPSFGNIGNLGAIKGRTHTIETDGLSILDSYLDTMSENDIAKYIQYFVKYFLKSAFPKHKSSAQAHTPEYFFDFRQIYLPEDSSQDSSSEEDY
uniref:Uncharacterized protein n=1 Tax=Strigamia maritima TaxID=126957 RepID=T1IS48_STRMM